jgi:hypothetical protein
MSVLFLALSYLGPLIRCSDVQGKKLRAGSRVKMEINPSVIIQVSKSIVDCDDIRKQTSVQHETIHPARQLGVFVY